MSVMTRGSLLLLATQAEAAVPSAPLNVIASTPASQQVTVTWDTPTTDGGSAILSYTVALAGGANPSQVIDVAAPRTHTFTGLANGTAYTPSVTASNANGAGPAGGGSAVTPSTVPDAPTIGRATSGDHQASVVFSAPASNGGSAITGYTVTATPGGRTGTGAGSPLVVTGLTPGETYTFKAKAQNVNGFGAESAASNARMVWAAGPLTDTLMHFFPLDETEGDDRIDMHGNAVAAETSGDVASDGDGSVFSTVQASHLQTANGPSALGGGDYRFWTWLRIDRAPTGGEFYFGVASYQDANDGWTLGVNQEAKPFWNAVRTAAPPGQLVHGPTALTVDVYHAVTGYLDAANDLMGCREDNGVADDEVWDQSLTGTPAVPIRFGKWVSTYSWLEGRLKGFAIWSSATGGGALLTPTLETWLYNAGAGRTYQEIATYSYDPASGGGGGSGSFGFPLLRRFGF